MALSLKDRKVQLRIAGGVVALLAVFLLLKVLGGGGGAEAGAPSGTLPPPAATPIGTLTPTPTPPPTELVFSGRDPFQNLFGSAGSSSTPAPSDTSTPAPTGSTSQPPSGGSTSPPPDGGGQGSSTTIGGHSVLLDDVFVTSGGVRKAQVDVDGTVYTVAAGESFDSNFKLVSFPSASCAHFVYGDEGFTLCTSGGK